MKIIVPMAGLGSRLRPHSLTTPKPLIPIAGVPIVHRLVKDIAKLLKQPIVEIAFILGDPIHFGDEVVMQLKDLAKSLNAKASIYRQDKPLGTGHAIMSAKASLNGPAVIAYADTLIRANFNINPEADAEIWVKQVENPEAYGVVKCNDKNNIIALIEKPKEKISNLAAIGIYYFKEVAQLRDELQSVLDNNIVHGGEYQINDGILQMIAKGKVFKTSEVDEWMDCGNKEVVLDTNAKMLDFLEADANEILISKRIQNINSKIIKPCYIGEGVKIVNSTIGPHVSVGANCVIENAVVSNSLIQAETTIKNATLNRAMIGKKAYFNGDFTSISIGDYSRLE